jgi:hypothetical protein
MTERFLLLRMFFFAVAVTTMTVIIQSTGNAVTIQPTANAVDLIDPKKQLNPPIRPKNTIHLPSMIENCIRDTECSSSRVLFLRLLENPTDLRLNVLYAKDAEKRGKIDLAIATYQRMRFLDPNNDRWKGNIDRLSHLSEPPKTNIAAVLGFKIDSNGALASDGDADRDGKRADQNGSIVFTLDDKRKMGGLNFQTTAQVYADANHNASTSDLVMVALQFGPLLNMSKNLKLRPALLFDRLATDRQKRAAFSYSAGTLFHFSNIGGNLLRTTNVSLYYVDFWNETPGKDAWVFTNSGELEYIGLRPSDKLLFSPYVTLNAARGGRGSDGFRDLYYETGLGIAYIREMSKNVEMGPTMSYYYRNYTDYEPGGGTKRNDNNFNIGLEATVINIIPNIIMLTSYSFERNKSKLANETYRNHSISVGFVKSF